jgi:hypothetical protein
LAYRPDAEPDAGMLAVEAIELAIFISANATNVLAVQICEPAVE